MGLFRRKTVTKTYDKKNKKPVIKASICNGEQVAGFKDIHTGKIEEVMPVSYTHLHIRDNQFIIIDDRSLLRRNRIVTVSYTHLEESHIKILPL